MDWYRENSWKGNKGDQCCAQKYKSGGSNKTKCERYEMKSGRAAVVACRSSRIEADGEDIGRLQPHFLNHPKIIISRSKLDCRYHMGVLCGIIHSVAFLCSAGEAKSRLYPTHDVRSVAMGDHLYTSSPQFV
jgi:hypothetical protein